MEKGEKLYDESGTDFAKKRRYRSKLKLGFSAIFGCLFGLFILIGGLTHLHNQGINFVIAGIVFIIFAIITPFSYYFTDDLRIYEKGIISPKRPMKYGWKGKHQFISFKQIEMIKWREKTIVIKGKNIMLNPSFVPKKFKNEVKLHKEKEIADPERFRELIKDKVKIVDKTS